MSLLRRRRICPVVYMDDRRSRIRPLGRGSLCGGGAKADEEQERRKSRATPAMNSHPNTPDPAYRNSCERRLGRLRCTTKSAVPHPFRVFLRKGWETATPVSAPLINGPYSQAPSQSMSRGRVVVVYVYA